MDVFELIVFISVQVSGSGLYTLLQLEMHLNTFCICRSATIIKQSV